MRQRITFLQQSQDSVDPKLLEITQNSVSTKELKAAKEVKFTFGLDELPQELYRVLKQCHELHVRWVSPWGYETINPLVSRASPGLHVFWTGLRGSSSDLLCPMLKKVFGELDCVSPEESFTTLPSERFSHSTTTQYYSPLPDLSLLSTYIAHKICSSSPSCLSHATSLISASSLDLDYDTISHTVTISTFHPSQTWPSSSLNITSPSPSTRVEVGFLSLEEALQPNEISLGGFLTVLGSDSSPSATLFSFPSRHHSSSSTFTSTFLSPTGLHPTLQLSISDARPPDLKSAEGDGVEEERETECTLHTYLTLPRSLFIDKYPFSDPLFLSSKNLSALHYISSPVDLEAPSYTLNLWGSSALLSLSPPLSPQTKEKGFTAQIPTHLRYLPPKKGGYEEIETPYPVVFWACPAISEDPLGGNPFDRRNLGYEGLFGENTIFYHLSPEHGDVGGGVRGERVGEGREKMTNELNVPVLDIEGTKYVEVGTAGVVIVGFLWVLWVLGGVWREKGYGKENKVVGKEKKKL